MRIDIYLEKCWLHPMQNLELDSRGSNEQRKKKLELIDVFVAELCQLLYGMRKQLEKMRFRQNFKNSFLHMFQYDFRDLF